MDIPRRVQEYINNAPATQKCFISYIDGESTPLSLRTFAYKKRNGKALVTEVMRETVNSNKKLVKNIYYASMNGYIPVYEKKDIYASCYGYRIVKFDGDTFDKWYEESRKDINITSRIINLDELKNTQYKYCGYTSDWNEKGSFINHLEKYSESPRIELLGKLGFSNPSKRLISKCEKDKQFVRYLYNNASAVNGFSAAVIIEAYKQGTTDFQKVKQTMEKQRSITRQIGNIHFRNSDIPRSKVVDYIIKNSISPRSYGDYIEAITELGLDLTDTKNIFPKDFQRMHEVRTNEYDVLKIKRDKEKNAKLWADFEAVSTANEQYRWECESYVIVMPHTIQDLINEGKALNHCVGKMGYDKKVVEGKCVIGFFRTKENPDKSYCTVELDGKTAGIKQAHTLCNGSPKATEKALIEQWSLFVKEQMKKQSLQKVN